MPFAPLEKAMAQFKERGLAQKTFDGRWHLTPEGFLVSNSIISDLLVIQDKY
jgi:oxygen-independent coproporphyrinogen-3 oxidase